MLNKQTNRNNLTYLKRSKGAAFTLVELLIVIVIIGILATMAIPQYQKMVEKAKIAEALINLKAVWDAEGLYYMENNKYLSIQSKGTAAWDDISMNKMGTATNPCLNAYLGIQVNNTPDWVYGFDAGSQYADAFRKKGPYSQTPCGRIKMFNDRSIQYVDGYAGKF